MTDMLAAYQHHKTFIWVFALSAVMAIIVMIILAPLGSANAVTLVTTFAWPVTLLVLVGIVFRQEIAERISAIDTLKFGDYEARLAQKLTTELGTSFSSTVVGTLPAVSRIPVPEALALYIDNISKQLGITSVALQDQPTLRNVVDYAARAALERTHEINYRLVYGSQIDLLIKLRSHRGLGRREWKRAYQAAADKAPRFYKDLNSDDWAGFLITTGYVSECDSTLKLSLLGHDFLEYITHRRYDLKSSFY